MFAHASASNTVVTIGSHKYTAIEKNKGVLIIIGHTLYAGAVALINGETISDANRKIVQAASTFASSPGDANGAAAATPSKGEAVSIWSGIVGLMSACCLALLFII